MTNANSLESERRPAETLRSMTGFARIDGAHGPWRWHWELRSVNGRGLDLRLRLPPGHDGFEAGVREKAQQRLTRGNVSISLSVQRGTGATELKLDRQVLAQVLAAARELQFEHEAAPPTADGLLRLPGVLEMVVHEETEAETTARQTRMLADFDTAVQRLVEARTEEGGRLGRVLFDQLSGIAAALERLRSAPGRKPEAVDQRLVEQVARLTTASPSLDPQRLHQEAVLLATRADIAEELARLDAHIEATRDLLTTGGAVGRRLDFLAQEFNRESNTICSKSQDVETTRDGLELKGIVDQMREQVQNIE